MIAVVGSRRGGQQSKGKAQLGINTDFGWFGHSSYLCSTKYHTQNEILGEYKHWILHKFKKIV